MPEFNDRRAGLTQVEGGVVRVTEKGQHLAVCQKPNCGESFQKKTHAAAASALRTHARRHRA